jgi:MoaA/NifB/PqqE/SkfB family radical SAM enzyme
MSHDLIAQIIKEASPFGLKEVIPSTMGEPLLYPWFDDILESCRKYGLALNLTTNGTFPGLGVEGWGWKIMPIASDVKISYNGATANTAESIMKGIDHRMQIENIRKLVEIRDRVRENSNRKPTITLQLTFLEKNFDELEEVILQGIGFGVDRIKGHHLWVTWPELKEQSLCKDAESRLRWNQKVVRLHEIAQNNKLPDGSTIRLENFHQVPGTSDLIPDDWKCPFLGREAWIAYDGTFNVCCAPDLVRRTLGYFGNVKENSFMDLWNSRTYRDLLETQALHETCRHCTLRRPAI